MQRVENGLIAVAILAATIALGQPWWVLFALFLLFDLSALGYLRGPRIGAVVYNIVHSFSGPALLATIWSVLRIIGYDSPWVALIAAAWAFHVAVDRALGYGLKLDAFTSTHLGPIGREARAAGTRPASRRRTFVGVDSSLGVGAAIASMERGLRMRYNALLD